MSGLLATIFSASDRLKRKVNGLLDDPMGTVSQHIGLLNDKAGDFNRLHSEATQESVNSLRSGGNGMGPKSQQLAGLLADAYNPVGMVPVKGPQSEALETARKNAVKMLGLPENNTPMDRARAMGFTDDVYHSTASDFPAFDVSLAGAETVLPVGAPKAVYTAKNAGLAERYARREGQRIMPLTVNPDGAAINNSKIIAITDPSRIRSRFAAFDPARINENDLLGRINLPMLGLLSAGAGGAAYLTKEDR